MPLPTSSQLHVNSLLSNLSVQYTQDAEGFIADKACPTVSVDKKSDIYPVWSKADFFRMQAQKLSDRAPAPEGGFRIDTSNTYTCNKYGLKKLLLDTEKKNADVNLDQATVRFLTEQVLIARDYEVVTTLLAEASWTAKFEGVNAGPTGDQFLQWDDAASTPFADIRKVNTALKKSCGRRATHLLVTSDVDDWLKEHPDALDAIKYTQTGIVTNDLLAAKFGVTHYLVADAVYNTAAEGVTASMAFMATKSGLLYYAPETASLDVPSACYNMSWSDFDQVPAGQGATISTWRNDDPEGEWSKAEMYFTPKVTAMDAGIFLKTMIA